MPPEGITRAHLEEAVADDSGGEPDYDLIVLGGGAAGVAAARAAAGRGANTLLVVHRWSGVDRSFSGAVPSKILLSAAARGISFADAMAAARSAVDGLAVPDSAETLTAEGIQVLWGPAVCVGPRRIRLGERELQGRSVVVATGSRPAQARGFLGLPALTAESVFGLDERPRSLAVLGGGPAGCEFAQAFGRLGVEVVLIEEQDRLLPDGDEDASRLVERILSREGIEICTGVKITDADATRSGLRLAAADGAWVANAEHVLVSLPRVPFTKGLHLDAAGVRTDERGFVRTDDQLATTTRNMYAAGDVTGRGWSVHAARAMGLIAAHNALSRWRKQTFSEAAIPRVVFTDPEVAEVGPSESTYRSKGASVARVSLDEVDRAIITGHTEGFVKLIGESRPHGARAGRVLGATIVADNASEMIHEVALAVSQGLRASTLATTVHAFPTCSAAIQRAAARLMGHGRGALG
jgi:pyruvate/2-oxoglutarate dehydrogenase complex dihydrolipoamide dehydrogenase (E3) component